MGVETLSKGNMVNKIAELGVKRMFHNNLVGAVDCFHKALHYEPTNYAHYLNRSYCYALANKSSLALNDAKYVLQNSKDAGYLFVAYMRAGMALYDLKDYQKALVYLKKANNINPDSLYAKREFLRAQIAEIVEMGYSERETILALKKCSSSMKAVDYLAANSKYNPEDDVDYTNYDDYVYSSEKDDTPCNTEIVNTMLSYTPGVTELQPLSAQAK